MSKKIKVTKVSLNSKTITFHRYWEGCQSHLVENGGNGYCRSITYPIRKYWYKRLKK